MTTVKRTVKKAESNRPTRPSSSFFLYMNDNRARIRTQNPDSTFGGIAQIGSAEWKAVKPVVKAKYEKLAEQEKLRYQREMETYVPSPEDKKDKKEKRKKKDPNAPKKAQSAYLYYVNSKRAKAMKEHPDYTMPQITSLIAPGWKMLSDKERKPFNDMAVKDKLRYAAETQ